MKALLLEDAEQFRANPSAYQANRQKINAAEYMTLTLTEAAFYDLVFMETNPGVWAGTPDLISQLTPADEPRTLRDVVDRIVTLFGDESPLHTFKRLSAAEPWFEGCFIIAARFDVRLFGELLVRPVSAYEQPVHPPKSQFYLEDGNHRALVYAVYLRLGGEPYQPVRAIWSSDWSHIYPWGQVP